MVERELVLALLEEGAEVGYGEAAPLPGYGLGDSDAAVPDAAALDLARWDLRGARRGPRCGSCWERRRRARSL